MSEYRLVHRNALALGAELVALHLPVATCSSLLIGTDGLSEDQRATINAYLVRFAAVDGGKCLNCGTVQGGFAAMIFGGFTWGIAYGEGACSVCGWPGRAIHRDIGIIKTMNIILQYHPDGIVADHLPIAEEVEA